MHSSSVCCAKAGSEIVRVLNPVKHQEKRIFFRSKDGLQIRCIGSHKAPSLRVPIIACSAFLGSFAHCFIPWFLTVWILILLLPKVP